MENKIYNDDVERIVNEPERQAAINAFHEKRQAKKQRKMLIDAITYFVLSLCFVLLGVQGLMTVYIAYPVSVFCGILCAFSAGRFFENGKCWGWY